MCDIRYNWFSGLNRNIGDQDSIRSTVHAYVVQIYLHKKDIIFENDILFMQIYLYDIGVHGATDTILVANVSVKPWEPVVPNVTHVATKMPGVLRRYVV